ncbi:MAG TPA: transposase, partial [Coleofasciculaceae cyanobacterium]
PMKAYSIDLRREIVDAYEQQDWSQRELARRFEVSPNFVGTVLKRHYTEGTVEIKPHTGGFEPKLAAQIDIVQQLLEQNDDATLKELCAQIEQKTQIRVSPSTLCRTLQRLKLTRRSVASGR